MGGFDASARLGGFPVASDARSAPVTSRRGFMESTRVRTATSADETPVVQAIVAAFAGDPVVRWCFPRAHQYLANMAPFTLAFGGAAFEHGAAHCTDDFSGAALWLPPGVESDEKAMEQIIEDSVTDAVRGDLYGVLQQMADFHPR